MTQMDVCVLWMGANTISRTVGSHSFENTRLDVVCFRCMKDHWILQKVLFLPFLTLMEIVGSYYCVPELYQFSNKLLDKPGT
jgi:hypothetical protein